MRLLIITLLACFSTLPAIAQTAANKVDEVYLIPFATSGNVIELDVVNSGEIKAVDISVQATVVPEWLELSDQELALDSLDAGQYRQASFSFSVDREATVGEEKNLTFEILSGNTIIGTKEFRLQVEPPTEVKLMQNFPNPFNPETTIGFDLPFDGNVNLRIFDILGREVSVLTNQDLPPGHHKVQWDASRYASGTYFYVLKALVKDGNHVLKSEKMLLVK